MTPNDFRAALGRAGITEDKPLYPVLMTVFEAAETAHAAATDGARGLTPEGERALIDRVGGEVGTVAEREVERLVSRADLRRALQLAALGLSLLGVGYGVGRWDGQRQRAHALEGAAFLAHVAEMNDVRALRRHCQQHTYPQGGGTACTLPPVWIARQER